MGDLEKPYEERNGATSPLRLNLLPPELLAHVLSNVAPLPRKPTSHGTYQDRLVHYSRTSLVCRAFVEPSQALMWSHLSVASEDGAQAVVNEVLRRGERYRTKSLRLEYRNLRKITMWTLFGSLRGIESLEVVGDVLPGRISQAFDLSLLCHPSLIDLKHLNLDIVESQCLASYTDVPFTLNHLTLSPVSKRYSIVLKFLFSRSKMSQMTHLDLIFVYGYPAELPLIVGYLLPVAPKLQTILMPTCFDPLLRFFNACESVSDLSVGSFFNPHHLSLRQILEALPTTAPITFLTLGYHFPAVSAVENWKDIAEALLLFRKTTLRRVKTIKFTWIARHDFERIEEGKTFIDRFHEENVGLYWLQPQRTDQ